MKEKLNIYIMIVFLLLINLETFAFTMGGVKDTSGVVTVGESTAEVWMATPAYVYRNYGESVNNAVVASGVKLFTLRHKKILVTDGYSMARVIYDLSDSLGGKYRIENVRVTKQINTSGVTAKGNTNGFITVENFIAKSDSVDAEVEISGDIIYSSGDREGKSFASLNVGVSYSGAREEGARRISQPFEFSTYTDVKIEDVSFGAVIPQLGTVYERYSRIEVQGGKGREIVATLSSDGGRGQDIVSTLRRAGSGESIPIKYQLVNLSNSYISDGIIALDSFGKGEARMSATIDSNKIPRTQKSGVYSGNVRVDVYYN